MSSNARTRIRLAVDRTDPFKALINVFTSGSPELPHGHDVQVELGLFNNGVIEPPADLLSITLSIKSATNGVVDPTGADFLTKTIAAASFNNQLTGDGWLNDSTEFGGSSYHAVINLAYSETGGLSMTDHVGNVKQFGLVLKAVTSIGTVPLASNVIYFRYTGAGAVAGTPPVATYTFSDMEIRSMLAAKLNIGENEAAAFPILRGANGRGILLKVDDSGGAPIFTPVQLP